MSTTSTIQKTASFLASNIHGGVKSCMPGDKGREHTALKRSLQKPKTWGLCSLPLHYVVQAFQVYNFTNLEGGENLPPPVKNSSCWKDNFSLQWSAQQFWFGQVWNLKLLKLFDWMPWVQGWKLLVHLELFPEIGPGLPWSHLQNNLSKIWFLYFI